MKRDPIYRTLYSLAVGFSIVGFLVLAATIVVRLVGGDETPNLDLVAALFVSLGLTLDVATALYRRATTRWENS